MKIKLLFIALIAILLSAGSVSAQHYRGHGRGHGYHGVRHGYHGPRHAYYGPRRAYYAPRHRAYRSSRVYVAAPAYRRGYGYHRGYRRGYYGHRRGYAPRARVSVNIGR